MSSATILPALDNTMGVLFLSAILWGAGTVQLYYYYNHYQGDPSWTKTLVAVVYLADTASQGLMTQLCYVYLITNYANPTYLAHLESTLLPIMLMTGLVSYLVQGFYIARVWALSEKNIIVTGYSILVATGQLVFTIAFYVKAAHFTEFSQLVPLTGWMHGINIISTVADVTIAGILTFLLYRRKTGFKSTETLLNRLIMFTVNTGLLCGLCSILTLACNIGFPNTYIYMIFYIMVCRVYVNSLLASLNARKAIRRAAVGSDVNTVPVSTIRIHARPSFDMDNIDAKQRHFNSPGVRINVDAETTRGTEGTEGIGSFA